MLVTAALIYLVICLPIGLAFFWLANSSNLSWHLDVALLFLFGGLPVSLILAVLRNRQVDVSPFGQRFVEWAQPLAVLAGGVALIYFTSGRPNWLIYGASGGLLLIGQRLLYAPVEGKQIPQIYTARYAEEQDIHPMKLQPNTFRAGDALLVGVGWQSLLGIQSGHGGRRELGHLLVAAPTRGGKGRHLTANLFNWGGSVITLDIKGENYRNTAGYRYRMGEVYALDPRGQGHRYDPFAELSHSDEALLTAAKLLVEDKNDQERAFGERASNGVYAALLAARDQNTPTLSYLDDLIGRGIEGFVKGLSTSPSRKVQKALTLFLGYGAEQFSVERFVQDRFLNSCWTLLTTRVAPLLTDGVLAMTSGNDVYARDLYERPTSLYLIFPETESVATGKLFSLVTTALMLGLMRAYDEQATAPNQKVLLLLDEVGRTPVPRLNDLMSTLAGREVSVALYIQSLSQLEEVYGRAAADTILDNCRTQIFYPSPNVRTQAYVSRLGGIMQFEDVSFGETWGEVHSYDDISRSTGGSVTTRLGKVELIQPATLRTMHPDMTWVFTADVPPILCWRLDPQFVRQEDIAPPELPKLKKPGLGRLEG